MENNINPGSEPAVIFKPQEETKKSFKQKASEFYRNRPRGKILVGAIGTLALLGFLTAGIFLTQQKQSIKTEASGVTLSLSTTSKNPAVGSTVTIAVGVDTGGLNVTAANLRMGYDPALFEFISGTPGSLLPVTLSASKIIANGVIDAAYAAKINESKSGVGTLAQMVFKVKANGTAFFTIGPSTAVAALGQSENNVVGTVKHIQITAGSGGGSSPTASPTPTPTGSCVLPGSISGMNPSGSVACSSSATTPVTFKWNAASNAEGYILRIDDTSNGWVPCGTGTSNPNDTCMGGITGTSQLINLLPGKTYKWWVSGNNACGQGTLSATLQIIVPPVCH